MTIKQRVKDVASHVGALVAVAALFALAASSASAEQAHVLSSSFGSTGSGALLRPVAVAVDSSSGPSAGAVTSSTRKVAGSSSSVPAGTSC